MNINDPVDVLARTLWAEARGCGGNGMQHVANVIINRANNPRWWGHSILEVCLKPMQFSCWNLNDPNRAKLVAVTPDNPEFATALRIAAQAVAGKLPDATFNADSYYALTMPRPPYWAAKAVRTMSDGWQAFYRVELPAPPPHPSTVMA